MSSNTAELTLILRAQNLAEAELAKVRTSLQKVAVTAGVVARDVANAFRNIGKRIGSQFGNLATDILSGGRIQDNLVYLGATMAGAIVEGLSAHFIPMILEKVMATSVMAPLAAAMAEGGVTLGTIFTTAIGVGITVGVPLLIGALIAALAYLAVNEEARHKVEDIAKGILGRIGDGLRALGGILVQAFRDGVGTLQRAMGGIWDSVVYNIKLNFFRIYYAVKKIVGQIIDAVLAIPRAVESALSSLGKLGGTAHTYQEKVDVINHARGKASGGWVGLNGPELVLTGEKGPEYVVPNHRLNDMGKGTGGFTIQGISEREIVEMVDRGLYFKLQRAAPTAGRV